MSRRHRSMWSEVFSVMAVIAAGAALWSIVPELRRYLRMERM